MLLLFSPLRYIGFFGWLQYERKSMNAFKKKTNQRRLNWIWLGNPPLLWFSGQKFRIIGKLQIQLPTFHACLCEPCVGLSPLPKLIRRIRYRRPIQVMVRKKKHFKHIKYDDDKMTKSVCLKRRTKIVQMESELETTKENKASTETRPRYTYTL